MRSADKKDAWTKPSAPNDKDETATNWLTKVDRLRTTSYEGDALHPPPAPRDYVLQDRVLRRPQANRLPRRSSGTIPATTDKTDYVARTEQTRWYATVIRSQAEQIEQDIKSVVTP